MGTARLHPETDVLSLPPSVVSHESNVNNFVFPFQSSQSFKRQRLTISCDSHVSHEGIKEPDERLAIFSPKYQDINEVDVVHTNGS